PDTYGEDRLFMWIADVGHEGGRRGDDPSNDTHARVQADPRAGHPVITVPTRGPADLGRLFLLAELAVAVAGWGLQINPFDQPNVQQAKDATNRVLGSFEETLALPEIADADDA